MPLIRFASLKDIDLLAHIEVSAASRYPPARIPQPHDSLPEAMLLEALKNKLLFCAEANQQVVGFAACHRYKHNLHLDEISVLPEYGQQGIGTQLVNQVLETAISNGLKACTLTTFADLPWNAPFYQKLGFQIIEGKDIPRHVAAMLREEKSIGLSQRVAMLFSTTR